MMLVCGQINEQQLIQRSSVEKKYSEKKNQISVPKEKHSDLLETFVANALQLNDFQHSDCTYLRNSYF